MIVGAIPVGWTAHRCLLQAGVMVSLRMSMKGSWKIASWYLKKRVYGAIMILRIQETGFTKEKPDILLNTRNKLL